MKGTSYLVGSGEDGLLVEVARRALEAVAKTSKAPVKTPVRIAISYAPVAGSARGLKFMSERMPRLFPNAELERFTVPGEKGATAPEEARAVVERADLVFVSGGDPSLGARLLDEGGASAWIRDAHARGAATMGVSAGSIALGAWWADWADDESGDEAAQLARTNLVAGVGVVASHVFDTHNEEDDWDELRIVAKLCALRGKAARFVGIPTGGALIFRGDGSMETVGKEPFVLG
jgi:cyanophycinase-like exopeptidase